MVDWVLLAVTEAGAKDIKVIVNPHHAELAAHFDERHLEVFYQREAKGTAHALQQIPAGELRGRQVLVVNGDSPLLTAASILKVIHAQQESQAPAAMASVEDPTRDDGRIVRSGRGELERIVERKDATADERATIHEFNVGVYAFDGSQLADALTRITDDNNAGEFYLTDVFLHMEPATVVENMRVAISLYRSMFGNNPVGTNPEITRALNGENPKQARLIKEEAGLRINAKGELVDY